MVELDLNPEVGDRVQRLGSIASDDLYEVVDRHTSAAEELLLKLRRIRDGKLFDNISALAIAYYSDEEIVRKVLRQILAECRPWPDGFQIGEGMRDLSYEIRSDEMHDGTPRVVVSFLLKPDASPTAENARIWNEFFIKLREQFQFVKINSWLQFTAKEERSVLRAAS
jgi:hypothetical protein